MEIITSNILGGGNHNLNNRLVIPAKKQEVSVVKQEERFNKKKVIGLIAVFILAAAVTLGFTHVYNEKDVAVYVDGERITGETRAVTIEGALKDLGIKVGEKDLVQPAINNLLAADGINKILVIRAVPVLLMADGEIKELQLPLPQVNNILIKENLELGPKDRLEVNLWPSGDLDDKFIKITRVKEETITVEEELEYEVIRQPDYRLLEGRKEVVEFGQPGLKKTTMRIVTEDEVEVKREILSKEVVREPERELVMYGTAKPMMQVASRGGSHLTSYRNLDENEVAQVLAGAKEVYSMEATAYTHTGNPTFTGIYPYVGVVAVDPNVIPLGSKLYVEGYGFGLAADTGGAIKGDIVDVFMDTREEALRWGRRNITVYLLETPE